MWRLEVTGRVAQQQYPVSATNAVDYVRVFSGTRPRITETDYSLPIF